MTEIDNAAPAGTPGRRNDESTAADVDTKRTLGHFLSASPTVADDKRAARLVAQVSVDALAEAGLIGADGLILDPNSALTPHLDLLRQCGLIDDTGRLRPVEWISPASSATRIAVQRERALRAAREIVDDEEDERRREEAVALADLLVDGRSFLAAEPDGVDAVWGAGEQVLWASGESLIIAGPQGVGKTTLAGNLVRELISDEVSEVLGLPVRCGRRVLYLAMDRPRQAARSLRRQLAEVDPEILADRLLVWKGPPPQDMAKHPEVLTDLAETADADVVIVDSLKDAAIGLSEDEVGAGWNRARQQLLVTGRDLAELHHIKKIPSDKVPDIADVFGSTWITSGSGSVVLLNGNPGDPLVRLFHLKQAAGEVGPLTLSNNADGSVTVHQAADLLDLARGGITVRDAACAVFETRTPSAAQVEKTRRRLDALEATDRVCSEVERGRPTVYYTAVKDSATSHTEGSRDPNSG